MPAHAGIQRVLPCSPFARITTLDPRSGSGMTAGGVEDDRRRIKTTPTTLAPPDPSFCHSRARGNPGPFAFTNETRKAGRAHRPAPTHRHPDSVGDDLQPALPVLSEAEGSGVEGCRPVPFQTTKDKSKDPGCPIKPGMTARLDSRSLFLSFPRTRESRGFACTNETQPTAKTLDARSSRA